MGIEPTLVAWEATVLPLNYTRIFQILSLAFNAMTLATKQLSLNGKPHATSAATVAALLRINIKNYNKNKYLYIFSVPEAGKAQRAHRIFGRHARGGKRHGMIYSHHDHRASS